MKAWLRDLWDAACLRTKAFEGLRSRPDAFLRGFLLILAVALVASLPALVLDLAGSTKATEVADIAATRADIRRALEDAAPALERLGVGPDQREQLAQGFELVLAVGTEVDALPAALPKPVGALLRSVGGWLSRPFADSGFPLAAAALGTWLGYGIWVMLFARLLGGRGTLHGFFGATALYAVPHLLGIFGRVPVLGGVLGVVAFAWGLAIYIKATAVSHELTWGRAALAAALPLLIVLVLVVLLLPVLAGIVTILALAGQ